MSRPRKITRKNRGAAAMEYGVIAALLSAAAIFSTLELGNQVSTTFSNMVWNLRAS